MAPNKIKREADDRDTTHPLGGESNAGLPRGRWRPVPAALPLFEVEPNHDNHLPRVAPSDVTQAARRGGLHHDG